MVERKENFPLFYVSRSQDPALEMPGDAKASRVCVVLFLLNQYWGIITVPGSFHKVGDLE